MLRLAVAGMLSLLAATGSAQADDDDEEFLPSDVASGKTISKDQCDKTRSFELPGSRQPVIRVSKAIQLTSQVSPPSAENACSKRQWSASRMSTTKRTRIGLPLNVSAL